MENSSKPRIGLPLIISFIIIIFGLLAVIIWTNRPTLIGSWKSDSGEIMTFYKDGTVTSTGQSPQTGSYTLTGTYKLLDNKTLKLEYEGLGNIAGPIISNFTIEGSVLKLNITGSNQTQKYIRLQDESTTPKI